MDRHHVDRAALPGVRERALLRHRLRTLFATHSCDADHRSAHPAAVAALWRHLAADGIAALGAEPARGGLREATIAMQELGRAACTLPLLGHLLGNLVLARERAAPLLDARVRERLHGGALRMTIAFTPGDDGGTPLLRGDRASGLFRGVDAALQATHLLLAVPGGLLVADLGSPGVSVVAADGTADATAADVRLESVAVDAFPLPSATLADLRLLAALLAVARRQGQGRRARDALGAADPVSCERLRSAVDRAAESFDFGRPRWREQAAHAVALAVDGPGVASWWPGRAAARASALPAALT
jgi:3-oxo-4-pregnene-20-carboxyl-CoA dehydrogenase beta subunit